MEESSFSESSSRESDGDSRSSIKSNQNSNIHNSNGDVVEVFEEQVIFDAMPIWYFAGGSSQSTQTINTIVTVAATSQAEIQTVAAATLGVGTTTTSAAAGATHTVVVGGLSGGSPDLVYSPNTLEAAVGDLVLFQFMSQNHTATQSAFTTPCEKLSGGFDTGFMPNANNSVNPPPKMAFQVTVSTPIWFYCRQTGHCGKGMTFSINPTANKTQAMFQQMAIAQNGTGTAGAITGGSATTSSALSVSTSTSSTSGSTGSSTGGSGITSGSGTTDSSGTCSCSCLCGVAAFPNAAEQGISGFGGMSGSIALSALPAK